MKITKLVHSCLLVEDDGKTALFDPGAFSKQAVLSKLDEISSLDYLIITHNHHDHLDEELVGEIAKRWPKAKLAAGGEMRKQLQSFNLQEADAVCQKFEAPHEALPTGGPLPDNSGWHFGSLSHPGDSLTFSESKEVLALPYVAPWGSTTQAVEQAVQVSPKYVVPIHDWHLSDEARSWYSSLLDKSLAAKGVQLVDLPLNQTIEIDA